MIEEFFLPHLEEMDVGDEWFQQARTSMELLREHFPGRLISLRGDLPWPARSPDVAPCDFFLWGYLKSIVYNDRPRTLAHLKTNIRKAIAETPVDILQRVAQKSTQTVHKQWRPSFNRCNFQNCMKKNFMRC